MTDRAEQKPAPETMTAEKEGLKGLGSQFERETLSLKVWMGSSHRFQYSSFKYATEVRSRESKQKWGVVEEGINKFENSSEEITQSEVKRRERHEGIE